MTLDQLLSTHADQLQALLGPLWPVRPVEIKQYGHLTKYTLGELPDGRWAHLHFIAGPDTDAPPHCHPCEMEVYTLQGSYWEREYFGNGRTQDHVRTAGQHHTVAPECIHSILSVSAGGYWSLCFTGPVVRAWQHHPELVG
jgi:hypothetical protein